MKTSYSTLWAGTDESWSNYMRALADPRVSSDSENEVNDSQNNLISVVDDVAIIRVHGTLVNTDAWYNDFFELVAYSKIVDALYQVASDTSIKEILLDISSGGGSVAGVLDVVSAVEKVAKIKKITAFTSSVMCSAAYWITVPAYERHASAVAIVGSIGVAIKHTEYSKMAEMEGIKETIIRSGEYKQIVNASEPLSDKAKDDLQAKADYISDIFVDSVSQHLGVRRRTVNERMGGGKEFIGQQAADVGLINSVSNFEDVFEKIQQRIQNKGGLDMRKRFIGAVSGLGGDEGINSQASEESPLQAPAVDEKSISECLKADSDIFILYKEQTKELLEAQVELASVKKELEALNNLKPILAKVINNMIVAFGGSQDEKLADADPLVLKSMYETTMGRTKAFFKVGGVALREDVVEEMPKPTRFETALKSVTINKK